MFSYNFFINFVPIFYETDSMAVVSRSEWKLRLNEESKSENFRIIQERQLIISWQWRSPTLEVNRDLYRLQNGHSRTTYKIWRWPVTFSLCL
jgi:hypothetical protein